MKTRNGSMWTGFDSSGNLSMRVFERVVMKKLLIDSLYINESGGLRLLQYLVRELRRHDVDFYLLADSRCSGIFDDVSSVEYMDASLLNRARWYQRDMSRFSSVLCFGNIPSPKKLGIPVYTYFHNINLLTLSEAKTIITWLKSWLKREVFRCYKKNTDYWLAQTSNTANELVAHLRERQDRVRLLPFYDLPQGLKQLKAEKHGQDFVYISTYVPGKGHEELVAAWRLLHERGIDVKLHLTVPFDRPFAEVIDGVKRDGVLIENHGLIPFEQIIDVYKQSRAIVYPSHNESLGLGIVEAVTAGCDVLGSDLPFLHAICKPSGVFDPFSPESIAAAVAEYMQTNSIRSELLIENQIENMIALIRNN